MAKKYKIFCDFDGTITNSDVGDLFFMTFSKGKAQKTIDLWEAGKIDSREMYLQEIEMLKVTPKEFDKFLQNQTLDSTFSQFVKFCDRNNFPLTILSDGMDLYIKPILERNHLGHLSVYANEMRWDGHNKLELIFPYFHNSCGRCANCKGYQIRRLREIDDHIVFVGDGLSDICGIKEADTIFAKKALADYCNKSKIKYFSYRNFSDITDWLQLRNK